MVPLRIKAMLFNRQLEVNLINEDKRKICNLLLPALQATRGASDLVALEYAIDKHTEKETVTAVFRSGGKKVADVTADSGTALIYDVIRQIF